MYQSLIHIMFSQFCWLPSSLSGNQIKISISLGENIHGSVWESIQPNKIYIKEQEVL